MCGIAGLIGVHTDLRAAGQCMLKALRHRGRDDEGVEVPHPSAVVVHSRLAILDLTDTGHQPMSDHPPDGSQRNWVVFNGQIFNFRDLQPELAGLGWRSRGSSDTEIILNAYRAWGEECIHRLHGMFAFCLIDGDRRAAYLCRDRMGIKPLYICELSRGGLAFASEIRALLALGSEFVPPRINRTAMESYFAQGAVQGGDAIVSGIKILEPGACLTLDLETGRVQKTRKYWDLHHGEQSRYRNRNEAVEDISSIARRTVRQHLVSDVPLGLFLSGGIDSAALLAIACEQSDSAMRTITVGFDIKNFDETGAASATASAFHCENNTVRLSGTELLGSFPSVLEATDQPTVDGTNTFIVSHAARKLGLTVALSGLGGDELFGGYASFHDVPRALRVRQWFGWTRPVAAALRGYGRASVKLHELLQRPADLLQTYLLHRELFLSAERRELQSLPDGSDSANGMPVAMLQHIYGRMKGLDAFTATSMFEIEIYMRHMLLRDADVFSMASPIECRLPFLDHELVQAVLAAPSSWKRMNGRPKPLLLDAVGPRLPSHVWQHPKQGFTFPWRSWLQPPSGALAQLALDAVHDQKVWREIGVNPEAVSGLWMRFVQADRTISALQILALVVLRDYVVRHKLRLAS
ncbi:MAG TPA: asparagine synthase (glutamine-hydrolyzing) [Candidatus Saccharimonadales bacterium]|nr:asparagine synthase (glutamine-hydrolyzing) [Candidatus Saccharimonadales bacterium]